MLNENYTYYNHPEFESVNQEEYGFFNDADKAAYAKLEADFEQYQTLKTRVIDLLSSSYTLTRLAIDTEPPRINGRPVGNGQWENTLKKWLESFKNLRENSHYVDQPSTAEIVETKLKQLFETLDKEHQTKERDPVFVMTSVSKAIMRGISDARKTIDFVEIKTPSGSGKTFTAKQFTSLCRKDEGFNCPIWHITLSESNTSLKHVLFEIVKAMRETQKNSGFSAKNGLSAFDNDYILDDEIVNLATHQQGGVLITDEAQNIFSGHKNKDNGFRIINQLRTYTDRKLFGIALLSNGEIYQHLNQSKSDQLIRRMEACRVDAGKPTAEDVELVMQAWQVSGKDAREWSIKVGTGKGGLGALTAFYRAAMQRYGEINYTILSSFRKV